MATYLILNLVFMLVISLALGARRIIKPSRPLAITFISLMILTAIFDNMIVGLSIVGYDTTKTLGLTIGYAPVEDFMYAVLSTIIVPLLWNRFGARHA